MAKDIFPGRVNVDMIFGRPKQTLSSWIKELNKVILYSSEYVFRELAFIDFPSVDISRSEKDLTSPYPLIILLFYSWIKF